MVSIQLGRVHPGCAAAGPHPGGQRPAFFPSPAVELAPLTLTLFLLREAKMENAATVVATKDCCRGVLSCASVSFPCLLKLHDSTHASLPQGFWL